MGVLTRNPVLLIQALPLGVINVLAAFNVFTPTSVQLGAINAVLGTVLAIVTGTQVVAKSNPTVLK